MQYLNTTGINRTYLLVLLLGSWAIASAQSIAVSPLTVFGIGEISENYFAKNYGMGGASIALRDPLYINAANPASYTALEFTTLETAISHTFMQQTVAETNTTLDNQNTYFNYFALGFKLTDWWGMSMSVSPFSSVGYNIYTEDSIADFGNILYEFNGSGGINQAVLGNAFEPIENFSIGFNARYLFGAFNKSEAVLFSDPQFYNAKRLTSNSVSSFAFDFGAQYEFKFKDSKHLILGATFSNQIDLNTKRSSLDYTFIYNSSGVESPIDSADAAFDVSGAITLPAKYGGGISYGQKHKEIYGYAWLISGEFTSWEWSEFRNFDGNNGGLNDAWRASLGGYFIPAYSFLKKKRNPGYFSRIEYRLGAFYENTQVILNDAQVTNYGLTAGFGLPVGFKNLGPGEKKSTVLNFGIVLGRKGNGLPQDIQESYAKLIFGITLGDQWFQKFKYR